MEPVTQLVVSFWETTTIYSLGISVLVVATTSFFGIYKYFHNAELESRDKRFERYHDLIKKLNQSDTPDEAIKLYRQVAVIYELRNFQEYYPVTERILNGWMRSKRDSKNEVFDELYAEMKLTLAFIKSKKHKITI